MNRVRRLIETPTCRRYVQIDIRDFLMSERELAKKYGVPWHPRWLVWGSAVAGLLVVGTVLADLTRHS